MTTTKSTKKTTTKRPAKRATTKKTPPKPAAKKTATRKPAPNAVTAATKKPAKPKPRKGKQPSGLDLAAKVLARASEPLAAKTIAEHVIAAGWQTSGKTPHATLYAAMTREIQTKGKDARFVKVERGRFKAKA
ncbi:MAG: winged helix-turn-helix domain-containing protein [Phycisphaera sp.]|nr:MAG: winged helix-turn-helix domain-containing protein [Phycisphaera sp.]